MPLGQLRFALDRQATRPTRQRSNGGTVIPATNVARFRRMVSGCDHGGPFPGYLLRMTPGLHSTPGPTTTRRRDLTLPAGFIPPCLPMMAPRPPSEPFWLHEIKHDGLRIIARKDSKQVRLYDRLGNDLEQRFPLIVVAV